MQFNSFWKIAISPFSVHKIPFNACTFYKWMEYCKFNNASHLMIREPNWEWEEIINALNLTQEFDFHIIIHNQLKYHLNFKHVHWSGQYLHKPPKLFVDCIQGMSCHNYEELKLAEQMGYTYAFLSPIFNTLSHPNTPALGVGYLKKCTQELKIPIVALGGITDENKIQQVIDAGASGFASIGYFSKFF